MADTDPNTPPATGDPAPTTPPTAPPAPPEPAPAPTPEDALGDAGKRALDAERAARKAAEKAAADALAKVKEYEQAQLSESEKLAARLKDAEEKAALADRLEVALDKGLPKALAGRLQGSTKEELAADADALLALVKADEGATPPPPPAPPAPGSLDGGARTPAPKASLDDAIAKATAEGDHAQLRRLNAMKLAQLAAGR